MEIKVGEIFSFCQIISLIFIAEDLENWQLLQETPFEMMLKHWDEFFRYDRC